jgi:DNA replication and repair protein RecF
MLIKALSMIDFRRYNQASLEFGEGTNILHGENGAGKTTILEAIHCLAYTRSFKTHLDANLLRHGQNRFQLKGSFYKNGGNARDVRLDVIPGKHKQMQVDGKAVNNRAEIIGRFPLVSLTPEDAELTFGSPDIRRQFMNKLFSQVDTKYMEQLQNYQRILKQRNAMLIHHAKHGGPINETLLDTLDEQMAELGVGIQSSRRVHFTQYKELLYSGYAELEHEKKLRATLVANIPGKDARIADFLEVFQQARAEDLRRGVSTRGPHRDILKLFLNQQDIRRYGSQGEHKLILVAMKFAEGRFLESHLGEAPVFLLDDLFAELDVKRSLQIVQSLQGAHQIFITATDLADLRTHGLEIDGGTIQVINAGEVMNHG